MDSVEVDLHKYKHNHTYNETYLLQCGPWVFGTCCSVENAGLPACQTAEWTNLSSPSALDSSIEPEILSFAH